MMTKDSSGVSSTQLPTSNDGRGRSYRPELGAAFEDRLGAAQQRLNRDDIASPKEERKSDEKGRKRNEEREGKGETAGNDNANNAKGQSKLSRKSSDSEQQQGQDSRAPFEGLAQLAPNPLRGLEMVAPVSSVAGLDPAFVAQLERIAAAIAEALPRDVNKQMTIAFGKADNLAQGAILTRDVSGAISIHIAGLHPGVTAAQSTRLQQDLRARLLAKKIDVREVGLADGALASHSNEAAPDQTHRAFRQV